MRLSKVEIAIISMLVGLAAFLTYKTVKGVTLQDVQADLIKAQTDLTAYIASTQPAPPVTQPSGLKPVITQLETSVIAGQGVNVNALTSTITSGTVLTTIYQWDFGDGKSQYNILLGWTAGHVYDTPGTYTITLTMTDTAEHVAVTTARVKVLADTRPTIYVDGVNGLDTNSGASPTLALKTADKAFSLVTSNGRILFNCGQTFGLGGTVFIQGGGLSIGAYGTGENPVLLWKGAANSAMLYMTATAKDSTIQGITFDTSNAVAAGPAEITGINAIVACGSNVVIRDDTFLNVDNAVDGSMRPIGIIVQNNSAPLLKGLRMYFCWVDGNNWTIVGNTVVNTTRAHCIRVNAADASSILIYKNNLTKQYPADDPGEDYKTTTDVRIGSYIYEVDNALNNSTVSISDSPGQTIDQTVNWMVLDGNKINKAQLSINYVSHHVMVRNNNLNITGTGQILITTSGAAILGAVLTDLTISHNTGVNTGETGEMIDVLGTPALKSITVIGNTYTAPNLHYGTNWTSGIHLATPNTSGFALVSGNVWPAPNNLQIPNVVNLTSLGYLTPSQWLALPCVVNDQFHN